MLNILGRISQFSFQQVVINYAWKGDIKRCLKIQDIKFQILNPNTYLCALKTDLNTKIIFYGQHR